MDGCSGMCARALSHAAASTSSRGGHLAAPAPGCDRRLRRVLRGRAPARCAPVASASPASGGGAAAEAGPLLTVEAVQRVAAARGISLTVRSLGPLYRVVCRDGDESGPVLGVTTGFVVPPLGLMHCDTLQVFTAGRRGDEGSRTRGGILGLGLLIGGATFAHGYACGCRKAEILAINDDDAWHQRLVAYYQRFGFVPVRVVEGGLADLPHMLVWGGVGTRMDADIEGMLRRWGRAITRAESKPASGAGAPGLGSEQ